MASNTVGPDRKPRGRKPSTPPAGLAARLQVLRRQACVSQEAIGAQGFVSAPGWIKVENARRSPSEKLLGEFVSWLVQEKAIRASQRAGLVEELMARKYAEHRSPFLAQLAKAHLASLALVNP